MPSADDYAQINEGLALYNGGDAWSAHEAWEAVWKKSEGVEKVVLQTLIQTAAAVHKHDQSVAAGVSKNLEKAIGNLARANGRTACWGLDLVGLEARLRRALAAAGSGVFQRPAIAERTGPDGFIYLHGFASSPDSFKARCIAPALEARGWHVAVPDLNQHDFSALTVSRALHQVRRHLRDRTILIGSSLGGYIASLIQQEDERVVATVLMAPAFDFVERLRQRHGEDTLAKWAQSGQIEVEHHGYGGMASIGYGLVLDAENHPPRPPLKVPTYVLQGRNDDVVPAEMVVDALRSTPEGRVTLELVDDDHALTETVDLARCAAESFGHRLDFRTDTALTP